MIRNSTYFSTQYDDNAKYILKKQFANFVNHSAGFVKSCYGEIKFIETGKKPTFSPYITVFSDIDMSLLWSTFTYHWKLFVPHVILTTTGVFQHHDNHWKEISNKSWIFTKGSSPMSSFNQDACIIAILPANCCSGYKRLTSERPKGSFPAVYNLEGYKDKENYLDSHHTHFIFVESTEDEDSEETVNKFRKKLLEYLGSRPIELDSSKTKMIKIPVLAKVTKDSPEELLHAAHCLKSDLLAIVNEKAKKVSYLLRKICQRNTDSAEENKVSRWNKLSENIHLQSVLAWFTKTEDKELIADFFKSSYDKKVIVYPSLTCPSLQDAVLQTMFESKQYSQQTATRLALVWNRVDMLKDYFSKKVVTQDNLFFTSCLSLALTLNRASFLELIFDAGINVYSTLTVRMLWILYYNGLMMSKQQTASSHVVKKLLKNKKFEIKNLLYEIGDIICYLTKYECTNIYEDSIYQFQGARKSADAGSFVRNLVQDKTVLVPHPERDLFIWCILTGKNDLAKILWKHGHDYMATALFASSLYSADVCELDHKTTEKSISTEHLMRYSKEWEKRAITFLKTSCVINRDATESQLMSKLPNLGNCSSITLAHAGKQQEFMALPQIQRVLDAVWSGSSRIEAPFLLILLCMFVPVLIPFTRVTKRKGDFTFFSNEVYHPFFTNEHPTPMARTFRSMLQGNSASIERQTSRPKPSMRKWLKRAVLNGCEFYNSPRITFIGHTVCLTITLFVMSLALISMNFYHFRLTRELHLFWIIWYMVGNMLEDIITIFNGKATGIRRKFRVWCFDLWNFCHLTMLVSYFTGLALYLSSYDNTTWYASKVLFCMSLILLYIRALQAYNVSKVIGPILQMIRRMLNDLIAFVAITGLLFWAYGVVMHSLYYEKMPASDIVATKANWFDSFDSIVFGIVNLVIRQPFWQIFSDALGRATQVQTTYPEIIQAVCTGIYVFFSSVLMLNLLIAMLSYTFENIKERSLQVWAFRRYEVVQEFADRPSLPSPFIIISHFLKFVEYFRKTLKHRCAFKRESTKQEQELCQNFETDVMEVFVCKEKEEESQKNILNQLRQTQKEMQLQMIMMQHKIDEDKSEN